MAKPHAHTADNLQKGATHHRAGRLPEAAAAYAKVLRADPTHADALHLAGIVARQQGDLAASERLIAQAAELCPTNALYLFNLGVTRELANKKEEALLNYRQSLSLDPQNLGMLQRIAAVAAQPAEFAEALALYAAFLSHTPDSAYAHYDLGNLHHKQGNLPTAIACLRRAIAIRPSCFEFHFNLAAALYQSGELADAAQSYRQAIELKSNDADAHYSLAVVLQKMNDPVAAAQVYAKALQFRPEFPDALSNLGFLCISLGDLKSAESLLRRAIELEPNHINAHCNLANVLVNRGDTPGAMALCRAALAMNPNHALVLCNYGALCTDTGDLQGAEIALRRSVAIDPTNVDAHCNLANAFAKQGNVQAATEATHNALAINPKHALTLCNFGVLLDSIADFDGAVRYYLRSLEAEPGFKLAQYNLSIQRLAAGDFAAGWQAYEARWGTPEFRSQRPPDLIQPQWQGEDIRGQRIVIYSEQGLGDTIQFIRYVPMVAARGATVVLRVQPALVRIVSTLDPSIRVVSAESNEGADFEWRCPLMSLPLAFATALATIPATIPYLHADASAVEAWSHRLPPRGLRIGLVWAGNPKNVRDRQRSIPLSKLGQITHAHGATFYSLQKGPSSSELTETPNEFPIIDLGPHLDDFTDTAAILANLDLVITVDTAVAHLAAAMGKPVWMLIARVNDWRWLRERCDTPWYPSIVLFRQTTVGQWDDILDRIESALRSMLTAQPSSPAYTLPTPDALALQA
jgi:tetratricopeptide (TPR) repeat protein